MQRGCGNRESGRDIFGSILEVHFMLVRVYAAKASGTAAILFAGDAIQQKLEMKEHTDQSYSVFRSAKMGMSFFVGRPLISIASWGIMIGPLIHHWYVILDNWKPGMQLRQAVSKTIADQALAAPSLTLAFFLYSGVCEGNTAPMIEHHIEQSFVPLMVLNYKIWPATKLVNFCFVPLHYRVFFVNSYFTALLTSSCIVWASFTMCLSPSTSIRSNCLFRTGASAGTGHLQFRLNMKDGTTVQRLQATMAAGVSLSVIACVCLAVFLQSTWFKSHAPYYTYDFIGYTPAEFVAILMFLFAAPTAVILLLVSLQTIRTQRLKTKVPHILVLSGFIAIAGLGTYWGRDLLSCGVIGCSSNSVLQRGELESEPNAGFGFLAVTGLTFLIAFLSITAAVLLAMIRFEMAEPVQEHDEKVLLLVHETSHIHHHSTSPLKVTVFVFVAMSVALILFGAVTTYLPDDWEYYTAFRFAKYARTQATSEEEKCSQYLLYTCPELPNAVFHTFNIKITSYWYLKVFPSSLVFYLFLILTPLGALAFQRLPQRMKSKKWRLPFNQGFFSLGECLFFAALAVLVAVWIRYWFYDHNYNGYWPKSPDSKKRYRSEIVARGFGQLAALFMGLLFIPASRTSPVSSFFGVSWEAGIKYHRWIGIAFIGTSFCHMISNYVWYIDDGVFPHDVLSIPLQLKENRDNFTVPLVTLCYWFTLFAMIFAVLETFRRRHFELFYYLHTISYATLVPAVLWHSMSAWEFIVPGIALWFFDRCLRLYRSGKRTEITRVTVHDTASAGLVVEIQFKTPFRYAPGQYAFLNVPSISLLQWHPFTISSCSLNDKSFHIKAMGDSTSFSAQLQDLAQDYQDNPFMIAVDGPYGVAIDFTRYSSIVLVAGGIGVTPIKSIFESFCYRDDLIASVHLVWVGRDPALFSILDSKALAASASQSYRMTMSFFVDNRLRSWTPLEVEQMDALSPHVKDKIQFKRPNFNEELPRFESKDPAETLLFVCGPAPVSIACEELAAHRGWSFHTETFCL